MATFPTITVHVFLLIVLCGDSQYFCRGTASHKRPTSLNKRYQSNAIAMIDLNEKKKRERDRERERIRSQTKSYLVIIYYFLNTFTNLGYVLFNLL